MLQRINQIVDNRSFFYVQVQNGGGYVASFLVNYQLNGINYHKDSGKMVLGNIVKIKMPKIATNVYVEVRVWFLGTFNIVYTANILEKKRLCLYLYGTIFYPVCVKVPCNPYDYIN